MADMHCMTCGSESKPKQAASIGGGAVLLVWVISLLATAFVSWLWLALGVIFHAIADSTRKRSCGSCGDTSLVPPSSPAAVAHRAQLTQPPSATPQ